MFIFFVKIKKYTDCKMKKIFFLESLIVLPAVLMIAVLVSYKVFAWNEPGDTPPGNNVSAPINTGSSGQIKSGSLGLGGWLNLNSSSSNNTQGITFDRSDTDPMSIFIENYGSSGTASNLNRLVINTSDDGDADYAVFRHSGCCGLGTRDNLEIHYNYVRALQNMYVDGNIGIGTTVPGEKLDVNGNIKMSGVAYQKYTSFTPSGSGLKWVRIPYGGQNYGNLPIHIFVTRSIFDNGSTPYGGPSLELKCMGREWHGGQQYCTAQYGYHGTSGAEITHAAVIDGAASGYYVYLRLYGGVTYKIWSAVDSDSSVGIPEDSAVGAPSVSDIYALTTGLNIIGNTTPNLYVAGNVGIGTVNPITLLDVSGVGHFSGSVSPTITSQGAYIGWNALTGGTGETDFINNPGGGIGGFAFMLGNAAGTSKSTAMFINGSGNIGIGTVSPAVKLDVTGNIWTASAGYARNSAYDIGGNHLAAGSSFYSYGSICAGESTGYCTGTGGVVIQGSGSNSYGNTYITGSGNTYFNGGNVGIGTVSPGYKLDVAGEVRATAFYYSSDARLKENVAVIHDGLEKVKQLDGVYFKWKDSDESSIGLIAQEVEKIFPEAVKTSPQTGMKSVDYAKLVAPLIEAVKTQQQQIEQLNSSSKVQQEEIADLKAQMEELRSGKQ